MSSEQYSTSSFRAPRQRSAVPDRNSAYLGGGHQDETRSQPPSLRRPNSRYSLNEQFAATRRDFEFGFDDGSSIVDRETIYSRAAGDNKNADQESLIDAGDDEDEAEGDLEACSSFYEALILPDDDDVTEAEIREAYQRLFLLFYPGSYPEDLRPAAQQQFVLVQQAFETLMDPKRRLEYDLIRHKEGSGLGHYAGNASLVQKQSWHGPETSFLTNSHLGIRIDARQGLKRIRGPGRVFAPKGLDYALGHSMTIGIPALRKALRQTPAPISNNNNSKSRKSVFDKINILLPSLTISGAAYGVVDQVSSVPITILSDRYQPLLPATMPRHRLIQLIESKLTPLVTARLRTGFLNKQLRHTVSNASKWVRTDLELESTVLPNQALTTRLSHQFILPNASDPTTFDLSVTNSADANHLAPRASVGARHPLPGGTAFFTVDSGDRTAAGEKVCRFLTGFAKAGGGMRFAEFPLRTPPSVEVGFQTWPTKQVKSTLLYRNQDGNLDTGSWSAAVTTSGDGIGIGGYVRYGEELRLPISAGSSPPVFLEAEACSDAFQGQHLAVRNLFSVGRTSKLGFEVGITTNSLHLSLHWSRLGQRLTLPLLICTHDGSTASKKLVFWAATASFAAVAAYKFLFPTSQERRRRRRRQAPKSSVTAHQRHADVLTAVLAHPVSARQKYIQSATGGRPELAILSAKFGVQDETGWGGEEVADVTIALAALVSDDGRHLVIPGGVRKACIPGFWDPDPEKEKSLLVRYSWKGKEAVLEVKGEQELVIPPKEHK